MLSSPLFTVLLGAEAHASTERAGKSGAAKAEQPITAKKRVSIHLESYADAKSAATAQEIAAMLEERLSRRTGHSRQPEYKKPAKAAVLKQHTKPAAN